MERDQDGGIQQYLGEVEVPSWYGQSTLLLISLKSLSGVSLGRRLTCQNLRNFLINDHIDLHASFSSG